MRRNAWRRLSRAEDLGAGFTLATHDLEIRGAGELHERGPERSQIQQIGHPLYMEMLERAVTAPSKPCKTLNTDQPLHQGPRNQSAYVGVDA